MANEELQCSFCGKGRREVRKIIAGPKVFICDECIGLCNDIIAEDLDEEPQPIVRVIRRHEELDRHTLVEFREDLLSGRPIDAITIGEILDAYAKKLRAFEDLRGRHERKKRPPRHHPPSFELMHFTRLFAIMMDCGLPLIRCLEILAEQARDPFARASADMKRLITEGATLSDALEAHPRLFDSLYIAALSAGEVGGILDKMLDRLSDYLQKEYFLEKSLKSTGAAGTMLAESVAMLHLSQSLGLLLSSGVPTLDALEIAAATVPEPYQRGLLHAREQISEGRSFAEGLRSARTFPPLFIEMVSVGETTGALDVMFGKLATLYEHEVERVLATPAS